MISIFVTRAGEEVDVVIDMHKRVGECFKMLTSHRSDCPFVFGKILADDVQVERAKNARVGLSIEKKLEGLADEFFGRVCTVCEFLVVRLRYCNLVSGDSAGVNRDLEGRFVNAEDVDHTNLLSITEPEV